MSLRLDDEGRLVWPDTPETRIFLETLWGLAEEYDLLPETTTGQQP